MSQTHSVWQCVNADCRIRFPSTGDHVEVNNCPICQAPVDLIGQHQSQYVPEPLSKPSQVNLVAVLDNIRSLRNVGAIFRTADAAGIRELYLCGYTATPEHPKLAKTALGAEQVVAWQQYRNALEAIAALKDEGYEIWAIEGGVSAESLFAQAIQPADKVAIVFGNETAGVDPAILAEADRIVALPMRGIKQSLNVETAFGIVAYVLTNSG